MRSIRLRAVVPTDDVALVFKQVTDFASYPARSPDVHSVEVLPATVPGEPQHSMWEANFRRGVMRWTEQDQIDPDQMCVTFRQVDGDFDGFDGTWRLRAVADGCEVLFEVAYDFGIDSLAGIMDPLAERVIKRAICAVLAGVVGAVTVVEGGEALTDLGEPPPMSGIRIVTGGD
ncbi:MAG TPA: SRPBCC family protein [Micromonosporaceae bacterium]|nr:SRPBCC family protein [Micromonosporaceae bacterium]